MPVLIRGEGTANEMCKKSGKCSVTEGKKRKVINAEVISYIICYQEVK